MATVDPRLYGGEPTYAEAEALYKDWLETYPCIAQCWAETRETTAGDELMVLADKESRLTVVQPYLEARSEVNQAMLARRRAEEALRAAEQQLGQAQGKQRILARMLNSVGIDVEAREAAYTRLVARATASKTPVNLPEIADFLADPDGA